MLVFTVLCPFQSSSPSVYYIIERWGSPLSETWYCYCTLKNVFHPVSGRVSSLLFWLFLKSIRWRLQCLLTVSIIKEQKGIPHIAQRALSWKWALKPPSLPPSHCCNRSLPISTWRASISAKHDRPQWSRCYSLENILKLDGGANFDVISEIGTMEKQYLLIY